MAPAAGVQDLPEFAVRLVRARAKALARRQVVLAHETEDVEQDLLLALWQRRQGFDSTRGRLAGFMVRVIDNAAADLAARRKALRRGGAFQFTSLHDAIEDDEGELLPLQDHLSQEMALWPAASAEPDAADLRLDLERAIARLAPGLRALCDRLSCERVAEISCETGASRGSIYASIAAIRCSLLAAGLHVYLSGTPTLSRRPR